MTIVEAARAITGGVDTHLDVHVAAALDPVGGVLGVESFPTTPKGYRSLVSWLGSFGTITKVGVEGTGTYGAGLTRFMRRGGIEVIEVTRPNREERRRQGKSDPVDAIEAARAALSGRAKATAKGRDGEVEAIRVLLVAKRSARVARIRALVQIRNLTLTGPDRLRTRLRDLSSDTLAGNAARLRPRRGDPVEFATSVALSTLGRRVLALEEEVARLDELLEQLVVSVAPELLKVYGVGVDSAAVLLTTAGDNPERLRSEAAFARLCGVAPLPASSGKTNRHRLSRGGDRQANQALWRIVMTRMALEPRTREYVERRTKGGLSKREVIRVLKRYVAREVYRYLPRP
ncbi:MAG TPA: IS110 family transposase [Acidimicrobiales bacterium]|nr:IS110 family transposase [Acidimicrobiales bacterium]